MPGFREIKLSPGMNKYSLAPSDFHRQLLKKTSQKLRFDAKNKKAWQKKLKRKFEELIGYTAPTKGPMKVRTLWKRKTKLGPIEKIVYTSEPHADVPAYLCLPANIASPYKLMICLQGHITGGMRNSIMASPDNENSYYKPPGDRNYAIKAMQNGFAALCIEQRSFGERGEFRQKVRNPHPCFDAVMQGLMLGRTLTAQRIFDVDRGIDYLKSRGDIAMNSIGVMGNSGGGTTSVYSAALLPRIAYAMPSCGFCTYADSFMCIHHCAENYIPGILQYAEMADIMGLFAPKPLVIVTGNTDPIFPLAGVKKAFRQLKKIYRAFGAGQNCQLVIGKGGHRFYAKPGWKKLLETID